jgi:hypothetical protein
VAELIYRFLLRLEDDDPEEQRLRASPLRDGVGRAA